MPRFSFKHFPGLIGLSDVRTPAAMCLLSACSDIHVLTTKGLHGPVFSDLPGSPDYSPIFSWVSSGWPKMGTFKLFYFLVRAYLHLETRNNIHCVWAWTLSY